MYCCVRLLGVERNLLNLNDINAPMQLIFAWFNIRGLWVPTARDVHLSWCFVVEPYADGVTRRILRQKTMNRWKCARWKLPSCSVRVLCVDLLIFDVVVVPGKRVLGLLKKPAERRCYAPISWYSAIVVRAGVAPTLYAPMLCAVFVRCWARADVTRRWVGRVMLVVNCSEIFRWCADFFRENKAMPKSEVSSKNWLELWRFFRRSVDS